MDSLPTSSLRFLATSGQAIEVPREWAPALIEILVPKDHWQEVKLWHRNEILPVYLKQVSGHVRVLADWPRSDPGHHPLRLELVTGTEERTVTIRPSKISDEAFAALLDDLETRLPAAVALGLQRVGALTGIKVLPPGQSTLAQELARLRRAVRGIPERPGLSAVLAQIAQDPHQVLETV